MIVNTREIRAEVAQLRAQLEEPGTRCGKRQAIHLIGLVERLADALDEARKREDFIDLYANLVKEWNDLVGGLHREFRIVVSQPTPLGLSQWHWRAGEQSGLAPTMAAAHLAGLRALMDKTTTEEPHP